MPLIQTEVTGFAEYPKIDTLFERDPETFVVRPSVLKSPVIATIGAWDVTEKIDGTNIRVMLSQEGEVSFGGRTNAAQIPGDLVKYLIRTFQQDRMQSALWLKDPTEAILYGEGWTRHPKGRRALPPRQGVYPLRRSDRRQMVDGARSCNGNRAETRG
jgi:hypothetical protein